MSSGSRSDELDIKASIKAVLGIANAICDTVADVHPDPAPAGPMYAAFNAAGGSYDTFIKLLDLLVKARRLQMMGNHCYALGEVELKLRGLESPNPHPFMPRSR